MKGRIIEFLLIIGMSAALLGGYYIFERIRAHNAMDKALLELIQNQGRQQTEGN